MHIRVSPRRLLHIALVLVTVSLVGLQGARLKCHGRDQRGGGPEAPAAGETLVQVSTVVNLADMGVQPTAFRFSSTTMESDRYIGCKDQAADGSSQVIVIDMHNGNAVDKRPIKAEATLMNPADDVIALRGSTEGTPGSFVQVFKFDTKEKLGVHQSREAVIFWKWIAPRVLALICQENVYHWNLAYSGSVPEKIFRRAGKLAEPGIQIISYATNSAMSWCLLTGISTQDQGKTIDGNMQLYSVEQGRQQLLEGHAGSFGNIVVADGESPAGLLAFTERKQGTQETKLHIMDISKTRGKDASPPFKIQAEIVLPPEAPGDFAVGLHLSEKHGVVYMITKQGFLLVFDIASATMLVRTRVSEESVFVSTVSNKSGGCILVNRKGQVIAVSVNEAAIVGYVMNQLVHVSSRQEIAFNLAKRFGLPGADALFQSHFSQYFAAGDYKNAAVLAAQCKSGFLRTPETIQQFKAVQVVPGQSSPILQYLSTLLDYGQLSTLESVEFVRAVVQQGRRELIEKGLKDDKLVCTEELGDLVKPLEVKYALAIYLRANIHKKVIQCLVEQGYFDQIATYANKVGYQADYPSLLQNMVLTNPVAAASFAKKLLQGQNGLPVIDINQVVKVFMEQNRVQETTSILLEALKDNRPDQAQLQTQLLAMNLQQAPKVAEAILQMNMFTHYDKQSIGQLCEKAGLLQYACEIYEDSADLKRVMLQAHSMSPEFLVQYFGKLAPKTALEYLHHLMRHSPQNLKVALQIAIKHHEKIGAAKMIDIFESFGSKESVFHFLGAILVNSTDPEVHFQYIRAASRVGNMQEVERVCRESTAYDPVKVKDFLKEAKLRDPRPLIHVCELHGYVTELTEYLYSMSLMNYIELYLVKMNPKHCPTVVGALIDLGCSEDTVKSLLQNGGGACPIEPLVAEAVKRNKLKLLLPWMEARVAEGSQDPHLHNGIAMVYIDSNMDPETFLKTNAFYDPATVGKYCEDRDPHLAYAAYRRAWGACDQQLIDVTNRNGLFRLQARYLVERQSPDSWALVLNTENQHRRKVIDQIVDTVLPETTNADQVAATVKAFTDAGMPIELVKLLETIVLRSSAFSKDRNLQNLLILSAIKADKTRVMDYIKRLDNYDGPEIAKIALGDHLFEEAFLIYTKFNLNSDAMDLLLGKLNSLERAKEFAAKCNNNVVWCKLGKAQLDNGRLPDAVDSYMKADDASDYAAVIQAAEREENYDVLVHFLLMARKAVKDQLVDTELLYSLARTDRLNEMEDFLAGANTANVQLIGDRLYGERAYNAAKILYASIPNNAKLASCHVQLSEYTQAIDAAKKANTAMTWREVNIACINAKQIKCAEIASTYMIYHPDYLEELVSLYEKSGHAEELISILDGGLGQEHAHVGMYTELAILYAKYRPKKLMNFIKMNVAKLNIPKVINACERNQLWEHTVYLYTQYDEYDSAANTIMAHSQAAFVHEQFLLIMQKVSNPELYYKALQFYFDEEPQKVNSLLNAIAPKLDHARVVQQADKAGYLALILPYLKQVQQQNIAKVNEAINDLYIETESHEDLKKSIEEYDAVDQIALAKRLENHELMEMRQISALLYKQSGRFNHSIELSKQDKLYHDAMQTARDSGSPELAESLIRFFVDEGMTKYFSDCLSICHDLLTPHAVLELAWRKGHLDSAMPYLIQTLREYAGRIDALEQKVQKKEEVEENQKSASSDYVPDYMMLPMPSMPSLNGLGGVGQG